MDSENRNIALLRDKQSKGGTFAILENLEENNFLDLNQGEGHEENLEPEIGTLPKQNTTLRSRGKRPTI